MTRRLQPAMATFSGPGDLPVPVCTFDGLVKVPALDSPLISAVFAAAFPAFKAGDQYYAAADVYSGRYRRFAGSDTLPRGAYSSVCRWDGGDGGCLVREIFSYAHPEETGIVLIDDMFDPVNAAGVNARYGSNFEPGSYLLLCCMEPERVIPPERHEQVAIDGRLSSFATVPYVTSRKRLERVVDLRLPAVQEWFFRIFSDKEWLNIHVPLPEMSSFLDLLPFLMGQNRGGNALTQAVGRELRLWGVAGLVYPSARCDAAVRIEDGDVVDWYGWNLVDYTAGREHDTPFNPRDVAVISTGPGLSAMFADGLTFFGVPKEGFSIHRKSSGTWQIVGLESLNLRSWKERLSPEQHAIFKPSNRDAGDDEASLHEIEKLLRQRLRALAQETGALALDLDTMRSLLGRLARGLMDVPFGGRLSVGRQKFEAFLEAEPATAVFIEIATGIGFLIEEPKDYFRFADIATFDYFTTVE
jgi:hypothetical protein